MVSVKGAFIDYLAHHTIFPTILFGIGYSIIKVNQNLDFMIFIFLSILFYSLQMIVQDVWYRANFGNINKNEIDNIEKHKRNTKFDILKNYLVLLISLIKNFKSFINLYFLLALIVYLNPKQFFIKEILYLLYTFMFFILSSGRFIYILKKR